MTVATVLASAPGVADGARASGTEPGAGSAVATWKQQTVGEFFARCNWENLSLPARAALAADGPLVLDYRLTVGQFFGAIPWDGGGLAAIAPGTLSSSGPHSGLFDLDAVPASNGSGGNGIDELPDLGDIADESHLEGGAVTLDDFLGAFSNSL